MALESRFQVTAHDEARYAALVDQARHQITKRLSLYYELAKRGAGTSRRVN
jgi:hypothetical protein